MQMDILQRSEDYCRKVIMIHGGSMLIDTMILLLTPIYLEQELKASSSMIGIALFAIGGVYVFSMTIIPYIAESKSKWLNNISYDKLIVIRLFLSIIVIVCLANVKSLVPFIILGTLNSIFNVGFETSVSTVSLLLPEHKIPSYTQMIMAVGGMDYILAAIILAIAVILITFQQLFYGCAVFYGLLFIFSLQYILNKESQLLSEQMELFDEEFYVEKKKRIANDISNKYRRRSSIAASIELYLSRQNTKNRTSVGSSTKSSINSNISQTSMKQKNDSINDIISDIIQHDDKDKMDESDAKRIDFPIYERSATEIVEQNKNDVILTNNDWIIIYLSVFLDCLRHGSAEIFSKWITLYLVTRFNASISISNFVLAVAAFAAVLGTILYVYIRNICKRLIYGKDKKQLNKREDIIITSSIGILNIIPVILLFLWIDLIPYSNYSWFVMSIAGFIGGGCSSLIPNLVIIPLNTEHLEPKILAMKISISAIFQSFTSLIMGLFWDISIHVFIYGMSITLLMMAIISLIIIKVASNIKLTN